MAVPGAWPPAGEAKTTVTSKGRLALTQLWEAYEYSQQLRSDSWQFAVEMESLLAIGLTVSDLRWLVSKGYADHACECTAHYDTARRFRPILNLTFPKRTCFVLSPAGIVLGDPRESDATVESPASVRFERSAGLPTVQPQWLLNRRELRLGDRVVKRYRVPSPNQELVLAAFEREGWPPRIGNPIPSRLGQDIKVCLHDTIKCLNRNQVEPLLRFRGDGTGEGVLWEPCEQLDSAVSDPREIRPAA